MVSSGSVEAASKSPGSRGFDLGEFPHWGRVKLSLQFFPPVTTNGRARVQPPKEVLSNGAKQWDNALLKLSWSWYGHPQDVGIAPFFGHSEDNCSKEKVVEDGVAKVDSGPENNCDGRVNNGDAKEGLSCDDDGSLGVNSHVSSMVEMSSPNEGIPCVISGESLESPNKFEILCSVVEGQDGRVVSPRKVRAAAGGVVDLMNQLKGKDESTQGQG
ncbi:hypothetical protein V6N11_024456 [Hibiscus sabdariffa]|uniref:Uncharacterized protein n=1 Tax=Hibiscus sabdariffa TaxID=183260 RepID=A0ABR2QM57_9ROSI